MKFKTADNAAIPMHLINQPLAIAPGYIDALMTMYRQEALQAVSQKAFLDGLVTRSGQMTKNGGIAVIPVMGVLQHRSDIWSWFFGTSTYEGIMADFRQALNDTSVKAILFDVASPGGEVSGLYAAADEIYRARGQKPIFASANEYAFSAAYALGAAADKLFLPKTGQVGSIGVIAVHADQSGWDEKIGIKYTPIFAGERKNDFSPHSPLSEEAYKAAKSSVDRAYGFFTEAVSSYRGIPKQAVIDTQAGIFDGSDAVKAGLADGVMTFEQVIEEINKNISPNNKGKRMQGNELKTQLSALLTQHGEDAVKALAELGYVPKSEAKPEDIEKIKAEAIEQATKAEQSRVTELFGLCELASLDDPGLLKSMVTGGVTVADARAKVMEAKAAHGEKNKINSTHGGLNNGGVNPLIANAQKRAGREG